MRHSGGDRCPSITGQPNYEGDDQRGLSVTWYGRTRHDWVFTWDSATRATINPEFAHRIWQRSGVEGERERELEREV